MFIALIRVLIVYITIIFSLRIMGKRQIGQLAPSELVVTILASNIATMSIEDQNVPLIGGVVPILTLVSFDVLVSMLSLKSKKARRIISGTCRVLVRDGKLNQKEMEQLRYSVDDVMALLRQNQIFDLNEVSCAIVETTGNLSVYPRFSARPVTPQDLGIAEPPGANDPPAVIISDGAVVDSGLKYCNLSYQWLEKIVTEKNLTTHQIFLMTCDRQANYTIIPRETPSKRKNKGRPSKISKSGKESAI